MTIYQELIRALEIFGNYPDTQDLSTTHDEIWAGPSPQQVTPEHLAELDKLGWRPSDAQACFYHFT